MLIGAIGGVVAACDGGTATDSGLGGDVSMTADAAADAVSPLDGISPNDGAVETDTPSATDTGSSSDGSDTCSMVCQQAYDCCLRLRMGMAGVENCAPAFVDQGVNRCSDPTFHDYVQMNCEQFVGNPGNNCGM
jgi:hypothetical protein